MPVSNSKYSVDSKGSDFSEKLENGDDVKIALFEESVEAKTLFDDSRFEGVKKARSVELVPTKSAENQPSIPDRKTEFDPWASARENISSGDGVSDYGLGNKLILHGSKQDTVRHRPQQRIDEYQALLTVQKKEQWLPKIENSIGGHRVASLFEQLEMGLSKIVPDEFGQETSFSWDLSLFRPGADQQAELILHLLVLDASAFDPIWLTAHRSIMKRIRQVEPNAPSWPIGRLISALMRNA